MKVDVYDIGQIYFSEEDIEFARVSNLRRDNYFAGSYFLGACNFFLKFFYFLLRGNKRFPKKENGCTRVLFYGISRNNRLTLNPVIQEFGEEESVSFIYQKDFPSWKLYWHALPHLFELIREIKKADDKNKKFFKLFFPKFWRMYGCPPVINEMLDYYKPEVVVMANDHQEFNRCLLLICKQRGIETVYVQHASVGTHFPPLQFSFSLLDGMDAFIKYKAIGNTQGKIYLIGGVRFDEVKRAYLEKPKDIVVGLAINAIDNEEKVKNTCNALLSMKSDSGIPVKLLFRPHPSMQEDSWKSWCDNNSIVFSSPKNESSFGFIGRSTFVIANQSSIHLDTAMCHKYSVIYNMSDFQGRDEYLFIKNELTKEIEDINDIQEIIHNINSLTVNEKAVRFFNSSYGTQHEGHVAGIICDLIKSVLNNDVEMFNGNHHFVEYEKEKDYIVLQ